MEGLTWTDSKKKKRDDADEGRRWRGGGEMGQIDGKLISELKRDASAPPWIRGGEGGGGKKSE